MKIYLATWLTDRSHGDSLTKKGNKHRLLSYYFLVDQGISEEQLQEYIRTGVLDPRKSKE